MIGRRIKAARAMMGIRQPELAARVGVVKQTIGNWECGRSIPDASELIRLSDALDVSIEWIVRGTTAHDPFDASLSTNRLSQEEKV